MPVINAAITPTGLCATCNNFATCVYRLRRGFDAQYCEMFDGRDTSPAMEKDHGTMEKPTATSQAASTVCKGLCVNCANREICTLPKPEEGVWHCEEYL
jgi:hypothetical protein